MKNKLPFVKALQVCAMFAVAGMLSGCFGGDPALKQLDAFTAEQKIDKTKENWKTSLPKPPKANFVAEKKYFWDLQTNKGNLSIEFDHKNAPMHVSSTVYLTRLGFYDGLTFHRVIPGFMAQGGDPVGNGTGSPGYMYAGEFTGTAKHDKPGLLSMANRGPDTDGSQFFITFVQTPHLNNRHTVFGEVVTGMDTLKTLETFGSRSGRTSEELKIVKATIRVE